MRLQVYLAEKAGFCAGVKRAFALAEKAASKPGKWYTLGSLVHNKEVVEYFAQKGIKTVENIDQIEENAGLIIRSHGVAPEVIEQARARGIIIEDATCPLVKRVHEMVALLKREGYVIVIFGDRNHPEVEGILGYCGYDAQVIRSAEEALSIDNAPRIGLVSQTTKDEEDFYRVASVLVKKAQELRIFNTICPATRERQEEALSLSRKVDLMLVIGDETSSNTNTLYEECKNTGVKTYKIQKAEQIEEEWLKGVNAVGITAGASTPDWIIKEVVDKMAGYNSGEKYNEGVEESFVRLEAEMADFTPPERGDIIKGVVVEVRDNEVMVDVGGKSEGVIPLRELTVREVNSAKEVVKAGDEIEVLVLKWDDDGTILLSKKRADMEKALERLEEAYKSGAVIEGTVIDTVKGGLLVDVGVVAFLPASHLEEGYVKDLDAYKGKKLDFKVMEFNRHKRKGSQVVLSRKEIVAEEKERKKQELWHNIAEGQIRKGIVKRLTDYGVFVDLGGFEGLLHVSELDYKRIEHPSDILKEGQEIEVKVIGLDPEKERIALSRKALLRSPWEMVGEKYKVGDIIEGTVVRLVPFGVFIQVEPGVDGLCHISQLANRRVEKPEQVVKLGEKVKVKILDINIEEKRLSLSIKEALDDIDRREVEAYLKSQE
ncbi:4-hydroxy-3-methylbut-2-enyl diphosphate reductase [Thermosyntropha lipolytica DSM 11003]|uniref:4-hydroxy-3-methylbut-2-enyl diphosphate reductase n=1 Tax=Thermosyntropha lipolytica DSM 11003 TaxID=1123382 RepID=A0A1M5QAL7_9FIRM|nr:bifunctional 4-hydroxy-3-methylbut-2-enyl diphosphate reductase/30S ribosomal protein S1 [Thermosyntropha lipolytica]SHH10861.1 4-hydroxy-3-methylbut-2-enyl diphosphate reductase [Thermosyntropha lipolytica DSM 11003]